jgi:hypothetical protein
LLVADDEIEAGGRVHLVRSIMKKPMCSDMVLAKTPIR